MKNVLFYISGHGFGHSTRICDIINEIASLDKEVTFYIKTTAPLWLFRENVDVPFKYFYVGCDVGIVQKDTLRVDALQTLKEYEDLLSDKNCIVSREVDFIKKEGISLVVGDIPPLAFDIAEYAGIPSVAVGNFSWDWIYEPFCKQYPRWEYVINEIGNSYRKAKMCLRLPFHSDMSIFPVLEDVPLVARKSRLTKNNVRRKIKISRTEKRKVILLSFGGLPYPGGTLEKVKKNEDYLFLSVRKLVGRPSSNVVILPHDKMLRHVDFVKASDLVVTKPGYGIVSECIANKRPLMYTDTDSREYSILVQGMKKHVPCEYIPREDLLSGNLKPHLNSFFARRHSFRLGDLKINGATVSAKKILSLLNLTCLILFFLGSIVCHLSCATVKSSKSPPKTETTRSGLVLEKKIYVTSLPPGAKIVYSDTAENKDVPAGGTPIFVTVKVTPWFRAGHLTITADLEGYEKKEKTFEWDKIPSEVSFEFTNK